MPLPPSHLEAILLRRCPAFPELLRPTARPGDWLRRYIHRPRPRLARSLERYRPPSFRRRSASPDAACAPDASRVGHDVRRRACAPADAFGPTSLPSFSNVLPCACRLLPSPTCCATRQLCASRSRRIFSRSCASMRMILREPRLTISFSPALSFLPLPHAWRTNASSVLPSLPPHQSLSRTV